MTTSKIAGRRGSRGSRPAVRGLAALATGAMLAGTTLGGAMAQPGEGAMRGPDGRAAPMARPDSRAMKDGTEKRGRQEAREAGRHHRDMRHGPRMGHHGGMMQGMSAAKLAGALSVIETGIGVRPDQMEAWRRFTGAFVAFAEAGGPAFDGGRGSSVSEAGENGEDDETSAPEATGGGGSGDDTRAADSDDALDAADNGGRQESDDGMSGETGDAGGAGAGSNGRGMDGGSDGASSAGSSDGQTPRALAFLEAMTRGAIERGQAAQDLQDAIGELRSTLTPEQGAMAVKLMGEMRREAGHERRGMRHDGGPRGKHGDRHGARDGKRHGAHDHGKRDRHDGGERSNGMERGPRPGRD